MRTKGYKCYNVKCGSCICKTLCGEPGDMALGCASRVVNVQTHADRIRAMSDEALEQFLYGLQKAMLKRFADGMGYSKKIELPERSDDIMNWLQQPVQRGQSHAEGHSRYVGIAKHFADQIKFAPTIAPESLVAHGRWGNGSNTRQPCSVCGYRANKHFNYCPNCGAKMDLEETP